MRSIVYNNKKLKICMLIFIHNKHFKIRPIKMHRINKKDKLNIEASDLIMFAGLPMREIFDSIYLQKRFLSINEQFQ